MPPYSAEITKDMVDRDLLISTEGRGCCDCEINHELNASGLVGNEWVTGKMEYGTTVAAN